MNLADEIRNAAFEKTMRGYRTEEVDDYLSHLAGKIEALEHEKEAAEQSKAELEKKMYILAEKIEQYRGEEDTLKTAFLNAQRMGDTVLAEAKQKSENTIADAQARAAQITEEADARVAQQEKEYARLQGEVTRFKSEVLGLYKQHIASLSTLPGKEEPVHVSQSAYATEAPAAPSVKEEQVRAARKAAERMTPTAPVPVAKPVEKSIEKNIVQPDEPVRFREPVAPAPQAIPAQAPEFQTSFGDYEGIQFDE